MPKQMATKIQSRSTTRLVWALWAIYLLLQIAVLVLVFLARSYSNPAETLPLFSRAWLFLPFSFTFPTVGALIAARHPRNPIGWLFLSIGFAAVFGGFAEGYWRYTLFVRPGSLPGGELMLWVNTQPYDLQPLFILLLILLFPTGRPLSQRWSVVGWLIILGGLINLVALAFMPGPLNPGIDITNPFGLVGAAGLLQFCANLGTYMLLLGMLGAILSVIVRLRRAEGIERQQVKLLSYALVLYAAAEGAFAFVPSQQPPLPLVVVDAFAAAFVAVAAGMAILRYRLWDIDIIIRRTLVYSTLTLTLGLVYLGCILVSRTIVAPLTGSSDLAIVASTLAIAALFNPLRRRIQNLIDKRFYRRKYDAAKVLAAFGATARDETDLDAITAEMLRVVDDTMQPEFVGLWLRDAPARNTTEAIEKGRPARDIETRLASVEKI
jgi:hypothetical protein